MIHGSRYQALLEAMEGLRRSGVALVGHDGRSFVAAGISDDLGLYFFVPKLARLFQLSLDQTIEIFFTTLLVVSTILAAIGFGLLFQRFRDRCIAYIYLLFFVVFLVGTHYSFEFDAVYIVPALVPLALIPLGFFLWRHAAQIWHWCVFGAMSGVMISGANLLRSHAGTPTFLFIGMLLFTLQQRLKYKFVIALFLFLGFLAPHLYFQRALTIRDGFLRDQNIPVNQSRSAHIFWHTAYLGFGFLSNTQGIAYNDEIAIKKVASIDPQVPYLSDAYEDILKKETLRLIASEQFLVFNTVAAKLGVIVTYFLFFANFGILAWRFRKKDWRLEVGFLLALLTSALPGFIAVPRIEYLLGFFSLTTIYAVLSINSALAHTANSS